MYIEHRGSDASGLDRWRREVYNQVGSNLCWNERIRSGGRYRVGDMRRIKSDGVAVSHDPFSSKRVPVPVSQVRIESVGVNALDQRRIDVAVDLTPCQEPVDVEIVIVGPNDDELCSALLLQNREWMLDRILHLKRDAEAGTHVLHIGVFREKQLVTRAMRTFSFPASEPT